MNTPEPLLSVVFISRNDDHGGRRFEVVVEEVGVLRDRRHSIRSLAGAVVTGTPLKRIGYCGFVRPGS